MRETTGENMIKKGDIVCIEDKGITGRVIGKLGIEEVQIELLSTGNVVWENREDLEKLEK